MCPECNSIKAFYHCHEDCRASEHLVTCLDCKTLYTVKESLLELARKVIKRQEQLKNEDIDTWAERLANDVANAND